MAFDFAAVLTAVLDQVIPLLELVAALIILAGGVWALAVFVRRRDAGQARREFSHALLLGLDYTIGADMLKLTMAPDLSAAALAAGVTGVRIALTLTLLREERQAMASHPPSTKSRSCAESGEGTSERLSKRSSSTTLNAIANC